MFFPTIEEKEKEILNFFSIYYFIISLISKRVREFLMEYTNSYRKECCLFEDVCDMSFSKDGRVICLTSSVGNIDGKFLVDKCFGISRNFQGRPRKKDIPRPTDRAGKRTHTVGQTKMLKCFSTEM